MIDIKAIKVVNYLGETLRMPMEQPEESGFYVLGIEGLTPTKADISMDSVATNDGSIYSYSRKINRNIIITLGFNDDVMDVTDIRHLTYKYFPEKKPIDFIVETDKVTYYTKGYVESNQPNIFTPFQATSISIVCPSAYLYEYGPDKETIFYGTNPEFQFPFSNESLTEDLIIFGNIQNKTEQTLFYNGDAEVGIKITIDAIGRVQNLKIYDILGRQLMLIDTNKIKAITGDDIIAGDKIIISTVQSNKYAILIRQAKEYNILNALGRNVPWFTLKKGENRYAYSADIGVELVKFRIENPIAYTGI